MNDKQFQNYYLGISKVGKSEDLDYLFKAWNRVYGCAFWYSEPWYAKDPEDRMPKICTRLKTKMISLGCDATTATRVIKYFKIWYADTYPAK